MDQHEDSVYGVAWSPADAWIYCSLSYDGRYSRLTTILYSAVRMLRYTMVAVYIYYGVLR